MSSSTAQNQTRQALGAVGKGEAEKPCWCGSIPLEGDPACFPVQAPKECGGWGGSTCVHVGACVCMCAFLFPSLSHTLADYKTKSLPLGFLGTFIPSQIQVLSFQISPAFPGYESTARKLRRLKSSGYSFDRRSIPW